ncbi:hypothetical protein PBI_CANTARE_10 [Brevibacterium phage Cantare]|uniref:Uncharacterized protein n=1 Tax=Brevibacterium phage Cantare TaxID=2338395 RepID=A0A3G3LYN8_9CAUD|nr:hypothetical protein PQD70_gp010 [Brevibacterium phage Cantare]AYQ99231.1 hypothetical protein PBI_CANTARE_10 [Brevibacterium phage Cantare]
MADPTEPMIAENQLIIDEVSGFALNIPAEKQLPYAWWITYPEHYKAILEMRKVFGIKITDNLDVEEDEEALERLFGEEN